MSFFNKVLSSVGIGAAKIDTLLTTEQAAPGQEVTGAVQINGGKADQDINNITLQLMCNYEVEVEVDVEEDGEDGEVTTTTQTQERQWVLVEKKICDDFVIEAGAYEELAFSLTLPAVTPLTLGRTQCWLNTRLDIAMALDKKDRDFIEVVPHPLQLSLFQAIESLGFEMVDAECEGGESALSSGVPFAQEFEFTPRNGAYRGCFDELEVITQLQGDSLEVLLEIDRKARGIGGFFAKMFDRDETRVRLRLTPDDQDELPTLIDDLLQQHR